MATINITPGIDCSSIIQLPKALTDNILCNDFGSTQFLVSQYQENTTVEGTHISGFYSKRLPLNDLIDTVETSLDVPVIKSDIEDLSCEIESWNDFKKNLSNHVLITNDGEPPYIISSITVVSSLLSTIGGYRLSTGMEYEFNHSKFDALDLSVTYDSSQNKIVLLNRTGTISSSINRSDIIGDMLNDVSGTMISSIQIDDETQKLSIYFNVCNEPFPVVVNTSDIGRGLLYKFDWTNSGLSANGISVGVDLNWLRQKLGSNGEGGTGQTNPQPSTSTTIKLIRW